MSACEGAVLWTFIYTAVLLYFILLLYQCFFQLLFKNPVIKHKSLLHLFSSVVVGRDWMFQGIAGCILLTWDKVGYKNQVCQDTVLSSQS